VPEEKNVSNRPINIKHLGEISLRAFAGLQDSYGVCVSRQRLCSYLAGFYTDSERHHVPPTHKVTPFSEKSVRVKRRIFRNSVNKNRMRRSWRRSDPRFKHDQAITGDPCQVWHKPGGRPLTRPN